MMNDIGDEGKLPNRVSIYLLKGRNRTREKNEKDFRTLGVSMLILLSQTGEKQLIELNFE
jgi:hypothetical protein